MKKKKASEFWKGRLRYLPILILVFFLAFGRGAGSEDIDSASLPGSETESVMKESAEQEMTLVEIHQEDLAGAQPLIAETLTQESIFYVHVCGCVKSPGVYSFVEGSRVQDAVEAAGGFTKEADTEYMNLAEPLADGEQIRIPSKEEIEQGLVTANVGDGSSSSAAGGVSSAEVQGLVNLNTADHETLMTLNGIGEVKAQSIIDYRETNGAFTSIEDVNAPLVSL